MDPVTKVLLAFVAGGVVWTAAFAALLWRAGRRRARASAEARVARSDALAAEAFALDALELAAGEPAYSMGVQKPEAEIRLRRAEKRLDELEEQIQVLRGET